MYWRVPACSVTLAIDKADREIVPNVFHVEADATHEDICHVIT